MAHIIDGAISMEIDSSQPGIQLSNDDRREPSISPTTHPVLAKMESQRLILVLIVMIMIIWVTDIVCRVESIGLSIFLSAWLRWVCIANGTKCSESDMKKYYKHQRVVCDEYIIQIKKQICPVNDTALRDWPAHMTCQCLLPVLSNFMDRRLETDVHTVSRVSWCGLALIKGTVKLLGHHTICLGNQPHEVKSFFALSFQTICCRVEQLKPNTAPECGRTFNFKWPTVSIFGCLAGNCIGHSKQKQKIDTWGVRATTL